MSIKPKPTPTLNVRPRSSAEVFAQTMAGAGSLWQETHIENLIIRTIKLLDDNFGLEAAIYMKREAGKANVPIGYDPSETFDAAVRGLIHERLQNIDVDAYGDGSHGMDLKGGRSFDFALLGEHDALVWKADSRDAQNPDLEQSAQLAQDFLIRQLQATYRWFCRINESQTLIHLDDLTGLYNHRYLELSLEREIRRSNRYNSCFSVLFIDLDNFKPVNDSHGHLAGSQVLREVAAIIRSTVRDVDLVFRYGGDEFVVLLIEADAQRGFRTAERIRERVQGASLEIASGVKVQVTTSIGIAAFPEHARDKERLLALADESMYESKRKGKNNVVLVGVSPSSTSAAIDEKDRP